MRFGGRQEKRRLQELSLWCRELAVMLGNDSDLVASLTVLERQDFSPALREMTTEMIQQAASDVPLEELIGSRGDVFPPVVLFAVRSERSQGRLAETLGVLADVLWQAAALGMSLTAPAGDRRGADQAPAAPDQTPVGRMVNSILRQALKLGAEEVSVRTTDDGRLAEVCYRLMGRWESMAELPLETLGPVCRRICIMAKINWWSREPSLGTLTIEHAGCPVDGSVRFVPGESENDQQVWVAFEGVPCEEEPS